MRSLQHEVIAVITVIAVMRVMRRRRRRLRGASAGMCMPETKSC